MTGRSYPTRAGRSDFGPRMSGSVKFNEDKMHSQVYRLLDPRPRKLSLETTSGFFRYRMTKGLLMRYDALNAMRQEETPDA